MPNLEKCFLIHVNLGGKPSKARIAEAARQIKPLVSEISPDHPGSVETFGGAVMPSPLLHDDSLLVLEIGDDVSGVGKTRVQAWFQHHRPTTGLKSQAASGAGLGQSQLADQLAKIKDKIGK